MNRTDRDSQRSRDDPITDRRTDGRTMADASHSHPFADRGALNRVFERGTEIAADGGRRGAYDEDEDSREQVDEEPGRTRMKDVNHTPPYGDGEEVDRVFERGGREEPVESEE